MAAMYYPSAMNRRLAILLLLPLFLVSCGGGSSTADASCKDQYWDGTVGLCLPEGWNVVARETLAQRGVPEDVIAAFQSEKSVSGQFPTVTVTRERLPDDTVDSPAYSKASIRSVSTLQGYKLVDTRRVVMDGQNLDMHIFSAQPLSEEPERKFYQISAVAEGYGYTYTALTPLSISAALEKDVLAVMTSATLRDPSGADDESAES